jgi:hypothetical protein
MLKILLIDRLLHSAVEQDPGQSIQKFIRYSLPRLIEAEAKRPRKARKRANA